MVFSPNEQNQGPGPVIASDDDLNTTKSQKKSHKKEAQNKQTLFRGKTFWVEPSWPKSNLEYNLVVMLPFQFQDPTPRLERIKNIMLEYWEGVELAIEALNGQGYNLNVHVFDTQNSPKEVEQILKKDVVKLADLIIGPVFADEVAPVELFCSVYDIPLVNPLRQYQAKLNTSVQIFNPVLVDSNVHYFAALELIKRMPNAQFVLFNDLTQDGFSVRKMIRKAFEQQNRTLKTVETQEQLAQMVNSNSNEMVVIAPTKSENLSRQVVSQCAKKSHVTVVGLEDWFDFSMVPFQIWEQANLMFYNQFFVNQNDSVVQQFNEKYADKFLGVPARYSYLGYDHTLFFAEALMAFGPRMGSFFEGHNFKLKHNNFKFIRERDKVFVNSCVNLLKLVDFELIKSN